MSEQKTKNDKIKFYKNSIYFFQYINLLFFSHEKLKRKK